MNMPPLNVVTTDLRRNEYVEKADLAPVMSSEEGALPRNSSQGPNLPFPHIHFGEDLLLRRSREAYS